MLELSPDGQDIVHSFEADLAARLSHLIAGWPTRRRQAAANILAALIDAIQHDLAEEDVAADRADKGLWPLSEGDDQSCSDLPGR